MYGLPADFDGAEFVGCTLVQVCFTINTVDLLFREGRVDGLQTTGEYVYQLSGEDAQREAAPPNSSSLMRLAEKAVASVVANVDGTLTLLFDDGATFTCFDNPHYEAYSITFSEPPDGTRWTGSRWAGQTLVV